MTLVEGEEQFLALQNTASSNSFTPTLATDSQGAATGTPAPYTSSAAVAAPAKAWAFFFALCAAVALLH